MSGVVISWLIGVVISWLSGVVISWLIGVVISWLIGVFISWLSGVEASIPVTKGITDLPVVKIESLTNIHLSSKIRL